MELAAALWLMTISAVPAQTGLPLWTNRYNGSGNGTDFATAIAVDSRGNVFVTGSSDSTNSVPTNPDYVTLAYSGAGVPLWTNRYNGPANGDDYPTAIALDGSGNVFVTGYSSSSLSGLGSGFVGAALIRIRVAVTKSFLINGA